MRIFVYEHVSAAGLECPSLRREGWAMLTALLEDLHALRASSHVEVFTLLHECLHQQANQLPADIKVQYAHSGDDLDAFAALLGECDAALIIAPETDGILEWRTRLAEQAGVQVLGSSSQAVALCTDKVRLADHLTLHGVPTPRTLAEGESYLPAVLKLRDGAGSQACFLVRSEAELAVARARARAECPAGEFLLQTYHAGMPCSASFLAGPDAEGSKILVPLPPATQSLSNDGRFHYQGGTLPIAPHLAERAQNLAHRALSCISGLRGFVGVDLVLGDLPASDVVIEINPRVTTSYTGLRQMATPVLAGALMSVAMHGERDGLSWRSGSVTFDAAGQVHWAL